MPAATSYASASSKSKPPLLHRSQIHDNAIKRRGRAEKEATDAEISARAAELAHRDYRLGRFSEASPQIATDRSNGTDDGAAAADAPAAKRRRIDGDGTAGCCQSRPCLVLL